MGDQSYSSFSFHNLSSQSEVNDISVNQDINKSDEQVVQSSNVQFHQHPLPNSEQELFKLGTHLEKIENGCYGSESVSTSGKDAFFLNKGNEKETCSSKTEDVFLDHGHESTDIRNKIFKKPVLTRCQQQRLIEAKNSGFKHSKPECLLRALIVPLLTLRKQPQAEPFLRPVDGTKILDYYDVIKSPIDLSTIGKKLTSGQYRNGWEFIDDMWLMFNNAWLYNKKTSKVYKNCSQLADLFKSIIDSPMKQLGYCCGQFYTFDPSYIFCCSTQNCVIPKFSSYWSFDRYPICRKCFSECKGEVLIESSGEMKKISKSEFVEKINNEIKKEQFVECFVCKIINHKICELYIDDAFKDGYICKKCSWMLYLYKEPNKFPACELPETKLGLHIEKRVSNFLKSVECSSQIIIKVVYQAKKYCNVKIGAKSRFVEKGIWPNQFPYTAKTLLAFQRISSTDICFFAMFMQEYDSECAYPNSRRVYVSYLDSVKVFTPKNLRTSVYHEIFLGYLDYVRSLGYSSVHLWSCPPKKGEDYVFHCHPKDQKNPNLKQLLSWYKTVLDKGKEEGVVKDYKDIYREAIDCNFKMASELPYFDGDFWPNALENEISKLHSNVSLVQDEKTEPLKSSEKDKKSEDKEHYVKCKKSKKKCKKSVNTSHSFSDDPLTDSIFHLMERFREVFLVIHLQQSSTDLPAIVDPDPFISSELMCSREVFLEFCRENSYEFSNFRRAMHSTMVLLYELCKEKLPLYSCNECKKNINVGVHCTTCQDYDLCSDCYHLKGHNHQMEAIDVTCASISYLSYLDFIDQHLSLCLSTSNCTDSICKRIKAVLAMLETPKGIASLQQIRYVLSMLYDHRRSCQVQNCLACLKLSEYLIMLKKLSFPVARDVNRGILTCNSQSNPSASTPDRKNLDNFSHTESAQLSGKENSTENLKRATLSTNDLTSYSCKESIANITPIMSIKRKSSVIESSETEIKNDPNIKNFTSNYCDTKELPKKLTCTIQHNPALIDVSKIPLVTNKSASGKLFKMDVDKSDVRESNASQMSLKVFNSNIRFNSSSVNKNTKNSEAPKNLKHFNYINQINTLYSKDGTADKDSGLVGKVGLVGTNNVYRNGAIVSTVQEHVTIKKNVNVTLILNRDGEKSIALNLHQNNVESVYSDLKPLYGITSQYLTSSDKFEKPHSEDNSKTQSEDISWTTLDLNSNLITNQTPADSVSSVNYFNSAKIYPNSDLNRRMLVERQLMPKYLSHVYENGKFKCILKNDDVVLNSNFKNTNFHNPSNVVEDFQSSEQEMFSNTSLEKQIPEVTSTREIIGENYLKSEFNPVLFGSTTIKNTYKMPDNAPHSLYASSNSAMGVEISVDKPCMASNSSQIFLSEKNIAPTIFPDVSSLSTKSTNFNNCSEVSQEENNLKYFSDKDTLKSTFSNETQNFSISTPLCFPGRLPKNSNLSYTYIAPSTCNSTLNKNDSNSFQTSVLAKTSSPPAMQQIYSSDNYLDFNAEKSKSPYSELIIPNPKTSVPSSTIDSNIRNFSTSDKNHYLGLNNSVVNAYDRNPALCSRKPQLHFITTSNVPSEKKKNWEKNSPTAASNSVSESNRPPVQNDVSVSEYCYKLPNSECTVLVNSTPLTLTNNQNTGPSRWSKNSGSEQFNVSVPTSFDLNSNSETKNDLKNSANSEVFAFSEKVNSAEGQHSEKHSFGLNYSTVATSPNFRCTNRPFSNNRESNLTNNSQVFLPNVQFGNSAHFSQNIVHQSKSPVFCKADFQRYPPQHSNQMLPDKIAPSSDLEIPVYSSTKCDGSQISLQNKNIPKSMPYAFSESNSRFFQPITAINQTNNLVNQSTKLDLSQLDADRNNNQIMFEQKTYQENINLQRSNYLQSSVNDDNHIIQNSQSQLLTLLKQPLTYSCKNNTSNSAFSQNMSVNSRKSYFDFSFPAETSSKGAFTVPSCGDVAAICGPSTNSVTQSANILYLHPTESNKSSMVTHHSTAVCTSNVQPSSKFEVQNAYTANSSRGSPLQGTSSQSQNRVVKRRLNSPNILSKSSRGQNVVSARFRSPDYAYPIETKDVLNRSSENSLIQNMPLICHSSNNTETNSYFIANPNCITSYPNGQWHVNKPTENLTNVPTTMYAECFNGTSSLQYSTNNFLSNISVPYSSQKNVSIDEKSYGSKFSDSTKHTELVYIYGARSDVQPQVQSTFQGLEIASANAHNASSANNCSDSHAINFLGNQKAVICKHLDQPKIQRRRGRQRSFYDVKHSNNFF